jgi:hypothetical protein
MRTLVPIVTASDVLAVLVCPVAEQLVALSNLLPVLRQAIRCQPVVVLVGNGPYRAADVENSLGVTVVAHLPEDREAAETLRNGGSGTRLNRSRLARSVTALGTQLGDSLVETARSEAS